MAMQCKFNGHTLQHASCALSPGFAFPAWKWNAKMFQKRGKFIYGQLAEFFENLLFHQFLVLVIQKSL